MQTIETRIGSSLAKRLGVLVTMSVVVAFGESSAFATSAYVIAIGNNEKYPDFSGDCTLCHTDVAGGAGTITRPFGTALKNDFGMNGGGDIASVLAALDAAAAAGLDVDMDGAPDVDEVAGGGDPNDPTKGIGGAAPPVPVEYGCVGSIAGKRSSTDGTALTVAVLAALALVCKRRR
jgi:hypothetical protein